MSELLHFAEHRLQEVTLAIMAVTYTLRICWLLRFRAGRDRQAPTAFTAHAHAKGALYSWAIIAMPWEMESAQRHFWLYVQFVVFHFGVTAAIVMSFLIPYAPGALAPRPVVLVLQALMGGACLVGCYRFYRRVSDKVMRKISTPDDYFSLALLTVWFFIALLAAPNRPERGEGALLAFFFLTAFFLLYVPFSKISHYLYYPFTRYYFGKTMGHRGVYPFRRGRRAEPGRAGA
jgi:nitrate reductase gamma subunit